MPITHYSFTAKYGCTENVGDYSNVRPELEVTLSGEGDAKDAFKLMDMASDELQKRVHDIVDNELEWHDRRVRYDDSPLYSLIRGADWKFLAIVPADVQLPKIWEACTVHHFEQLRYEHLLRKLRQEQRFNQQEIPIISPHDLPIFSRFTYLEIHRPDAAYLIILIGDIYRGALDSYPPLLMRWYEHSTTQKRFDMPYDIFLGRMEQLSIEEGLTLINCITPDGDNDFSVLPPLPIEPTQKEPAVDIPFDEEDEENEEEEGYDDEEEDE